MTTIKCVNGSDTHAKVVKDHFGIDFRCRRIPGDCFCQDCKQALPAWWNGGNPIAIEPKHDQTCVIGGGQ